MKVKFWGVRGTLPCPGISHSIYGGNTSCVEVECDGESFIFDAGSGIRNCGAKISASQKKSATVFISHFHHDHVMGFPFFSPAYQDGFTLSVCSGRHSKVQDTESRLSNYFSEPYFPVRLSALMPQLQFVDLDLDSQSIFGNVVIKTIGLNHPGGSTGYRLTCDGRSVCYITDVEHKLGVVDEGLVEFIGDTDLLIYDSTYDDSEFSQHIGWGHSTWQQAIRLGKASAVKKIAIFHHDPAHDDTFMSRVEREVRMVDPESLVSRDGLEVVIL